MTTSDLGYALVFRNGNKVWGADAYDVIQQMRGGWNPESVFELRLAFARRAGIYDPDVLEEIVQMSDEEYIDALVDHEFWTVKRVPLDVVRQKCKPSEDYL